jgi:hypothetical protein
MFWVWIPEHLIIIYTLDHLVVGIPVKKTETNDRGDPLRWPRNTLYPLKLALLRQQAAVARSD